MSTLSAATCLFAYEVNIDYHHDMFVNVGHRIPENANRSTRWVNNIIYNWSYYANEWLGAMSVDDINNKFITGNYERAGCANLSDSFHDEQSRNERQSIGLCSRETSLGRRARIL